MQANTQLNKENLDLFSFPLDAPAAADNGNLKVLSDQVNDVGANVKETVGTRYSKLFAEYCDALDDWHCTIAYLSAKERALGEQSLRVTSVPDRYKLTGWKVARGIAIRDTMIQHFETQFQNGSITVPVDRHLIASEFPVEHRDDRHGDINRTLTMDFDPEACWNFLEARYGGEQGIKAIYRRAAAYLVKQFSLNPHSAPKIVSGMLVLELRVWRESYGARDEYSSTSTERIRQSIDALACFGEWLEKPLFVAACRRRAMSFSRYTYRATSRETLTVGDGVLLQTFFEKALFKIPMGLATELQIFLSEFGYTE